MFAPLAPLLSLDGSLHEWLFRLRLDHWMTLVGMLVAYYAPQLEALLQVRGPGPLVRRGAHGMTHMTAMTRSGSARRKGPRAAHA